MRNPCKLCTYNIDEHSGSALTILMNTREVIQAPVVHAKSRLEVRSHA